MHRHGSIRTVTAFLIASVTLSTSAAAQVLTLRDDYASNLGARAIVSADFNRDGWLDVAHANLDRNSVTILLNQRGSGLVVPRSRGWRRPVRSRRR